jgi:hypothetical protein
MNVRKCLTIGLVLGVVMNVMDFVVQANLLSSLYRQPPFRQDIGMAYLILGDFVAAFVFAWLYLKIAKSFPKGPGGGALLGFYAGVFLNFPTNIFIHMMIANIPYGLTWIWTAYGVASYVILGAIAGAMKKD